MEPTEHKTDREAWEERLPILKGAPLHERDSEDGSTCTAIPQHTRAHTRTHARTHRPSLSPSPCPPPAHGFTRSHREGEREGAHARLNTRDERALAPSHHHQHHVAQIVPRPPMIAPMLRCAVHSHADVANPSADCGESLCQCLPYRFGRLLNHTATGAHDRRSDTHSADQMANPFGAQVNDIQHDTQHTTKWPTSLAGPSILRTDPGRARCAADAPASPPLVAPLRQVRMCALTVSFGL